MLAAMRDLTRQHTRYGNQRIQALIARQGLEMSAQRSYRLWRQARLQVPPSLPRRRIASGRIRPTSPSAAKHVWAYDFVYDRCSTGQQLNCPTVIHKWTRQCLAIERSGTIRSRQVTNLLARLFSVHHAPHYLRSHNRPKFVSRAILKLLADANIDNAHIDPDMPCRNATNESFNDKFCNECLSLDSLPSREEARVTIASWRQHYVEVHPPSSLGYLPLSQFINQSTAESDQAAIR